MHKDLHRVLLEISNILTTILEPSLEPEQLALVRTVASQTCKVIEEQAVAEGKLVVSRLVTELVVALLSIGELPKVVMKEVMNNLPDTVRVVLGGKIDQVVSGVWAKLAAEFWLPTAAISPRASLGTGAKESRLGRVLSRLCNDLVDAEVLAPVRTWYRNIRRTYILWIAFLFLVSVMINVTAAAWNWEENTWLFILGMSTLACCLAQAAYTWFYLVKRAEYLTEKLMGSVQEHLLALWEREDLVELVGDLADVGINEAARLVWPLEGPVKVLYTKTLGGREGLLKLVGDIFEEQVKPIIVTVFEDLQAAEADEPALPPEGRASVAGRNSAVASALAPSVGSAGPTLVAPKEIASTEDVQINTARGPKGSLPTDS